MTPSSKIGIAATTLGALGVALGLALVQAPAASAQPGPATQAPMAAMQAVIDRAAIEDLLTRYYYNLGHSTPGGFTAFYADDAELVLGGKSYKGKEGVESAYKAAGGANNPAANRFSFQVLLSNPLVTIHGDAATAQLIFTEIVIDKQGDAPRLLTQGREYDNLVKVGGEWKFHKRQITPGAQEPAGWGE